MKIFGDIQDSFSEINLMYGRGYIITNWMKIEFFAGFGYFIFDYKKDSLDHFKVKTMGTIIQSRLRFSAGKVFSLGLQFHNNINSINNIHSTGIFLQWEL